LYDLLLLVEYRTILRRLKVPVHASHRSINQLRRVGAEAEVRNLGGFSWVPRNDPGNHV
jgi:hypothetical protein